LFGEIDLLIGYVGGIGGVVMVELVVELCGWLWWLVIIVGLVVCFFIGLF